MSQLHVAPQEQPASFMERGAYVPLTTPMLVGGRVRLTDKNGLELVVPKASGGRGNYLAPWDHIGEICELGVHDTRLIERIGRLRSITPATVRDASWHTAAEGFAGRRVQAAARAAIAAAAAARAATHYHLLFALVRQVDGKTNDNKPIRPTDFAPFAQRAIGLLAVQLHLDGEKIVDAFGALAGLLALIGLGDRVGVARVPALLASMQAVRQSLAALPITTEWEAGAIALVTRTTDVALACLAAALGEARRHAESPRGLLSTWLANPVETMALLSRADWLADGWAWLCHLWAQAPDLPSQRRALNEIILVLPDIPREVAQWGGFGTETVLPPAVPRNPSNDDHDSLTGIEARMRNELLLALAA